MKKIARYGMIFAASCELIVLSFVCLYGKHGWYALHGLEQENIAVIARMQTAERKINYFKEKIASWHAQSFFVEQIAREQLHLARAGDIIIYY